LGNHEYQPGKDGCELFGVPITKAISFWSGFCNYLYIMLKKEQHIDFWRKTGLDDWDTAEYNMKGKRNTAALFFFHLCVEKLLKAAWVRSNVGNTPPFSHDLVNIANQTELEIEAEWYDYLNTINRWNIEGRYPDYKMKLHAIANEEYMNVHFNKVNSLKEWLLSKI
jgi:HEPN domain-containing protein